MLAVVVWDTLYQIKKISFYSYFVEYCLSWMCVEFCWTVFCICWDDHVVFFFYPINKRYRIHWFSDVIKIENFLQIKSFGESFRALFSYGLLPMGYNSEPLFCIWGREVVSALLSIASPGLGALHYEWTLVMIVKAPVFSVKCRWGRASFYW